MKRALYTLVLATVTAWLPQAQAQAPATPVLKEWTIPWDNTRPRDPFVGPQPNTIWFVGQDGDYVATLNPQTGALKRYRLPPGTGPHNVIADDRGTFYSGNRAAHIGLIDPESGDIETFRPPGDGPRDVHTMAFSNQGGIWFTEQGGNRLGRLDVEDEQFQMYDVKTEWARPYGLVVGPGNRPWATLFGTNRLATVTEDDQLQEIPLPREQARPRRLGISADGSIWYVDYAMGYLGRVDPVSHRVEEWPTPGGPDSRPYAMAVDDQGRAWFVETGPRPNRLIGFDPQAERFSQPVPIPSGGGTVRHMVFDPDTHALWFGTDTNTLVRATLGRGE